MTATVPPDHAERIRALNPTGSFIVQAPAGSGKTELLVRRYLTLLAQVDEPEQILAITFTRKATAEMRMRISNALTGDDGNGNDDGNDDGDPQLAAIVTAARENDRAHGWNLAANTRRLRVQTIDAFCSELVRRMPWSARFGAPPHITEDARAFYLQAAARALDHIEDGAGSNYADACKIILRVVDANLPRAQSLLADMLAKREEWMPVLTPASRENLRAYLEAMWREMIDSKLANAADMLPADIHHEIIAMGAFAAGNLGDGESPIKHLRDAKNFPASHGELENWNAVAELLLTKSGSVRARMSVREGFPPDGKTEKEMKARMKELLAQLADYNNFTDELEQIRNLPRAEFSDAQWQSIDAMMTLLPVAAAELRLFFKDKNCADYIELTQRATHALGESDAPTDLALVFDYQLQHLLMDEFQDTSAAHVELLGKLTAGWQDGDGRTLFLVGDPMQSIYRFREAEVANFLAMQQHGVGDVHPESIVLQSNFRSAPALVNWFNETFDAVLPEADDIVNGAVSYSPARAHITAPADTPQLHLGIKDEYDEADAVAALVKKTHADHPEHSIAVLGRNRVPLFEVAAALRRHGVAFQAVELERLTARPATRDLLSLTRALVQPADRIAWLSLLRAPWCGLCLADLTALAGGDHRATLSELARDASLLQSLTEHGRARLATVTDALADSLTRRGRIGVRQNVEAAWLRLGGPATVATIDLEDCMRYLDLLDALEAERVPLTADNLQQATEAVWARGGGEQKVQLLTIHKAKGLEFDSVFLPCLARKTRSPEKTLIRWRKLPDQLLTAPLPSSTEKKSDDAFYKYLAALEKIHTRNELGRLLYVACTRARKNLHLFGSVTVSNKTGNINSPPADSLLALLWDAVALPKMTVRDTVHVNDAPTDDPQTLTRLPHDWQPPPLPRGIPVAAADTPEDFDAIEFSWAGETARIVGIVVHHILQHLDEVGWEKWCRLPVDDAQKTRWRNLIMDNGIYGAPVDDALARVVDAVQKTRADKKAEWIFSAAHRDIKTEWELTGRVNDKTEHIAIDRVFTDADGVCWIIDFKVSHHTGGDLNTFLNTQQERYQSQLEKYATIIRQLQSPTVIKLGLYFPAMGGWREWTA